MTNSILTGSDNLLNQIALVHQGKNLPSNVEQKNNRTPSFNTILTDTIKQNENQGATSSAAVSSIQQELMKLIVMTQYEMNSAFFSAFDESDESSFSNDDSMNWMGDLGASTGLDTSMLNIQQPSASRCDTSAGYQVDEPASIILQSSPSIRANPEPVELNDIISQASKAYNVDKALIQAVIRAESNFDPNSTSPKGAMGLMQLMPETAKELGVKDAYNPVENIHAGTRYLKRLLDRYDGNIPLALTAYNWGMGNVERLSSRIPRETQTYIARVNQFYQQAKT